ncbi:MAG: EAL domain-containing protein [Acidimicrobiia bacterium]|nr:EAL domain-containing protein [Acidimicrobiia bacterium]
MRLLFVAVALVPIVGLGWLSTGLVADASQQSEKAAEISMTASRLNQAIRLQADITAESLWANALASSSAMGIPLELVAEITGVDVEAEYRAAILETDSSIDVRLFPGTEVLLDDARDLASPSSDNSDDISLAYDLVEARLGATILRSLGELNALVVGTGDAEDLTDSVRVLERSVSLREDLSSMTEGYFTARFPTGNTVAGAEDLLRHSTSYDRTLADLKTLIPDGSPLKDIWIEVDESRSVGAFLARVDELTDVLIVSGTDGESFGAAVTPTGVEEEAQAFLDSLDAVVRHVGFVDAAAADVTADADAIQAAAEASKRETLTVAGLLGVAAALAVVAASWWIIRPLRRMAGVVERLRDGHLGEHVREAGPREVRSAARALNEAVDHLVLAEHQAIALADEDLDSPVLKIESPGRLGASLQQAVSALAGSLTEREEFRQRLAHEAAHDGLTGLANRSATMADLTQALARVRRSDHELAVLFIDIDGFKSINDAHGHAGGDRALRIIAGRIAGTIRSGDQLGRIGGDEFVVIAEPMGTASESLTLGQRILDAVAMPLHVGEVEVRLTASIGVALGGTSLTADEILRDADLAVYKAKSDGRARLRFCDEELREELRHRVDVEHSLERALEDDELVLHYQPITDAHTGKIVAVEALVRWQRASGRLEPPANFIPIAERSDLIIDVDRWVIRHAARQMRCWEQHPALGDITVSVNLSARHLTVPSLVDEVLGPLRDEGMDPRRLTVELTETALLSDLNRAADALAGLRTHGVRIAIDDFGTGYTSLTHLRRLPVDILKIDRSFVAGLDNDDDRSLVKLIVDIGHVLGVSITAEGVETDAQADAITTIGGDHLQGFGIGRPMAPTDLEGWAAATMARLPSDRGPIATQFS